MNWVRRVAGVFLGGVSASGSRGKGVRAPRGRRVVVEALEDRRLLSVGGTFDFGDLPDNYGTTLAADGARHEAVGPTLGALRDAEVDGLPTAGADGDDANGSADEDGVTFGEIRVGQLDAQVTVNVQNAPSGAKLDAWIDFNGDGSFGGAGEQIADTVAVSEGDNVVEFDVPSWAVAGETFARFRLSSAGDLAPRGAAADGEVEDHAVTLLPPRQGSGVFAAHELPEAGSGPEQVLPADVDGDGDMDLLVAFWHDDRIGWYENDGAEEFTFHTISASADTAESVFAADVDSDGDVDVLSASRDDGKIAWYENDGHESFTAHTITTDAQSAMSVLAADVDGDGDMDVLSASRGNDPYGPSGAGGIAWYRNDGNGVFTRRTVSSTQADSVFATDVDGDGDMDLLSAEFFADKIRWFRNDGNEGFTSHTISDDCDGAISVFAADLDRDGDMDVLSASYWDGTIAWHENDGDERFTAHTITSSLRALSVGASDMDGDGDTDVLSYSGWHENDGNQGFTPHKGAFDTGPGRVTQYAIDVDGDGDMDVFSASDYSGRVVWHEQVGTPLGEVDFRELPDLDLTAEQLDLFFHIAHTGYLTINATFAPAAGDVTLRLLDSQGELIQEVTGTDGYLRIDHIAPAAGTAYELQVSGTNTDVDLRICNLVSQSGDAVEVFDTDGEDTYLFTVTDTFNVTANGVEYRFDDASTFDFRSEGGKDTIELVDSAGDDVLTATYEETTLAGTLPGGQGYSATAHYFDTMHAYAKEGGNDSAHMTGQVNLADRIKIYPGLVKTMSSAHYHRAKFFETVEVDGSGGGDWAIMVGSEETDAVWAERHEMRVDYDVEVVPGEKPSHEGRDYDVVVVGTEWMVARAGSSSDWLELHDSVVNDVLIAKPHKVEMMNGPRNGVERGAEYCITARGFRNVSATADNEETPVGVSNDDTAKLYDSGEDGVDIWAAGYLDGETWSTMSSPSRLLYEVLAFEHVGGYGFNGGLGEEHGVNRKEHADDVDFVFQYGYWEGGEEVVVRNPRNPRG